MARILVVDDEEGLREFIAEVLEDEGHGVVQAADGEQALEEIRQSAFDLVLTDLKMPRMGGLELLEHVGAIASDTEVIVVTAHGSVEVAVEAMKRGAFDFLQKPLSGPAELRLLVARALERRQLKAAVEWAERAAASSGAPELSYGAPAMVPVVRALEKVSPTNATVLLTGESGTGKEVAARTIHRLSPRASGPFVAVNCAALSEYLLESELFGHEKGAFTGADSAQRGRIELADGGTFFLDEIGELKLELQAKLLRVLQERKLERVGGRRVMAVDVRWVAATNRNLEAMMAKGAFREDLYHRLALFPVRLPALSERREDILPLAKFLLRDIAARLGRPALSLSASAKDTLERAPWRGNVRELANALERAAILSDGNELQEADLSFRPAPPQVVGTPRTLQEVEREAIALALESVGGKRKQAAEVLGIPVRTLYDKLKKLGLA